METSTDPVVATEWRLTYQHHVGKYAAAFFAALRDQQILGSVCASCARVNVPPKGFCEICFVATDSLVAVGNQGRLEAIAVLSTRDAATGEAPTTVAFVRLDGATSSLANFVRVPASAGSEPNRLRIGGRVQV